MKNVVFAGNPGSGKSTLLNTLIGKPVFTSGVAFGGGLTTTLDTHVIDDVRVSDTPGLDDVERKKKAALEIQKGLNEESQLMLVFVITLESGRLRPADVTTIEVVLSSLSKSGVDVHLNYSLIVNRLSETVYTKIQNDLSNAVTRQKLFNMFKGRFGSPKDVLMIQEEKHAVDKDNVLLDCTEKLEEFLRDAPVMVTSQKARVDPSIFSSIYMGVVQFLEGIFNKFQSICNVA